MAVMIDLDKINMKYGKFLNSDLNAKITQQGDKLMSWYGVNMTRVSLAYLVAISHRV